VLGKALLWLLYSPYEAANKMVPVEFKNQIRLEWNEIVLATDPGIECNSPLYNPIKKVPVVITGDEGCVNIDVIPSLDENGNVLMDGMGGGVVGIGNGGAGGRGIGGGMASTAGGLAAQLLAVQSLASQIRRELQELRSNQMADRVETRKGFTMVNTNIRRIALQPGLRGPVGTVAQGGTRARGGNDDDMAVDAVATLNGVGAAPATLSPTPRNVYELWQEYQVGIGGRKAARLFTSRERGGNTKYKYHRRLVIWRIISGLVRGGMTADAAIDSIYAIYGHQTSVTTIINQIRKQKNDGTLNPNLRI
jgi:Transcriptional activator of glycolytic enzymes